MTSKQYILSVLLSVFTFVIVFVAVNLYLNLFGLFADKKEARIWVDEKTSKYLLSYKYIPDNFEGVLIGPSVSANLDTRGIDGYRIYNLSMNGGNISEIKYAVDNVISSNKLKYLVICLYPYLTKNSGLKGRQINEKEYWGSLYSMLPVRMLFRSKINKLIPGLDQFHSSEWGYNDTNIRIPNADFNVIKNNKIKRHPDDIHIDEIAYGELRSVIESARNRDIKIIAYYYPMYYEFFEIYNLSGAWKQYKYKINKLFSTNDIVWDMNADDYKYITQNVSSYSDGHLSDKGAEMVADAIEEKMKVNNL